MSGQADSRDQGLPEATPGYRANSTGPAMPLGACLR